MDEEGVDRVAVDDEHDGADSRTRMGMNGSAVPNQRGPASYLALGDSYTRGEGVAPDRSWPVLLARALTSSGLPVSPPRVLAQTGWTARDLAQEVDRVLLDRTFDLVSLLIGVNDQYQGRDLSLFDSGFQEVLARAVGLAGGDPGRVMVLSIPDWSVTPHAEGRDREKIGRQIEGFNEVKRERSRAAGATFVDLTGICREEGARSRFLSADGLHPSGAMYARWVDATLQVALEILDSPPRGRRQGGTFLSGGGLSDP